MRINKPKFWSQKINLFVFFLYPFTLLVLLIIFFKKKLSKKIHFNIPIICVGNIYIGGTGKTPASIFLANELLSLGKKPVIIRKYYKSHIDEHKLIKNNFKNLILCKNRIDGIELAKREKYDSIILDDGFQDYKIKKNFNIVCFHENQLIGNGLVLPSGPLRESLGSLNEADIILINGKKNTSFEKKISYKNKNLQFFYSRYLATNIDQFRNKKLLAIAGIGNPDNFFKILNENNLIIEKKLIFPDHYKFTKSEFIDIANEAKDRKYQIIMTEKDYFKIKDFNIDNIKYLKISLKIDQKEKFIKLLSRIYDKKN
jgi:tetraacyldisaccharide 4'-kinase